MKRYITAIAAFGLTFLAVGCENWLDVKPKQQIEASRMFSNEQGFKDALYGVYTYMTGTEMYGMEMTWGMVDVLGYMYAEPGSFDPYKSLMQYDYRNAKAETTITNVWASCYNTIANINSLTQYLTTVDRSMFQPDNYEVIMGEAVALRAYLHFDLLRLFAPSYKAGRDKTAIPYVREYGYRLTPFSTVSQVLDKVMEDLTAAADLLGESDPIVTGRQVTASDDNGYLLSRPLRMNYYAVRALMARVALYRGDLEDAGRYAQEVIDSPRFRWTTQSEIATVTEQERNRTFVPEQIFALHVEDFQRYTSTYLGAVNEGINLVVNQTWLSTTYPAATNANDWRRLYFWSNVVDGTANSRCCTKLWQYDKMPAEFANRMPLIRLPEIYLIAAEAALATDPTAACELINTLRVNRGVEATVTPDMGGERLREEIMQEYIREFSCEGVVFYYYKRVDANRMQGAYADMGKSRYTLPVPTGEFEFRPQGGSSN